MSSSVPLQPAIVIPHRGINIKPGGAAIAPPLSPDPNTVSLDPSLFPPAQSTPINVSANQAIVGAGARFTPAGLVFKVPDNCYGIISTIDLLLDSILIGSNVLWTLLVNGIPVPGFNPITILGRNGAASVSKSWPGPLRILIPVGGTISWTIQDVDGAAYTAGTSYYGWFWPQQRTRDGDGSGGNA